MRRKTHAPAQMQFGVGAFDAARFATVAMLLVGVAALASYLPARRLTAISPVEALREA